VYNCPRHGNIALDGPDAVGGKVDLSGGDS
jgi:hypothetical protein